LSTTSSMTWTGDKACGHGPEHDYRRCPSCQRVLPEAEGRRCHRCSALATRLCRSCQTPDLRTGVALAQARALREALEDCVDSLDYVERNYPGRSGYGVRQERIEKARAVLKACD
jgi:hypothetical protein